MHIIIILTAFLITGCVQTAPQHYEEQWLAVVPGGWHLIYHVDGETTRISDLLPDGETANSWTTKLTFESFGSDEFELTPADILEAESSSDRNRCRSTKNFPVFSGQENGYETAVRLFFCGKNKFTHKGEVKLIKVIQGLQHSYFIRFVKRTEPFTTGNAQIPEQVMAIWSMHLGKIKLCDGSDAHPCPEPDKSEQ